MNRKAQEWIRRFGPRRVCEALPKDLLVTDSAVYHWLAGRCKPSYERAEAMAALAKTDSKFGGRQDRLTIKDFRAPHEQEPAPAQAPVIVRRAVPRMEVPRG